MRLPVIITSGLPGSGKSTWARSMADKGYYHASTDVIRKGLFGSSINIYDSAQTNTVWELFEMEINAECMKITCGKSENIGIVADCMGIYLHMVRAVSSRTVDFMREEYGILADMYIRFFPVPPEECRMNIERAIQSGEDRADIRVDALLKYYEVFSELKSTEGIALLGSFGIREWVDTHTG